MSPLLDQVLVAALVVGAVAFFIARFRRKRAGTACSSDCGCSAKKPKAEGSPRSVS